MRRSLFYAVGIILPALFWVSPLYAQLVGRHSEDSLSTWRVVGALTLCLVLAVLGAFALRARSGIGWQGLRFRSRSAARLELLETLRLNRQVTLNLVRCDRKTVLLVTSAQGAAIHELPPEESSKTVKTEGNG